MKAYETAPSADLADTSKRADQEPSRRTVTGLFGTAQMLRPSYWAWVGPILIMLFGGFIRFYRLSQPNAVVFDETYYVPDANSILRHGVELNHVKNVNTLLLQGNPNFLLKSGEIVAHPPLGKIMMAMGQWTFGLTPFGWRFSVAVIGTVSILMTARIARRMTGSTLLGCIAGLLLALDGLELVLSRTSILDIFLMFWVLAAFGLLVIDRDQTRARLEAAAAESGPYPASGPHLGIRWMRVCAGLCLGAACATKWNGLWYLIAFAGMAILWDLGSRRAAGYERWLPGGLRSDARWLPVWFGLAPFVVYFASWSGWFFNTSGYDRDWAPLHGNHTPIWSTLDSWYQYNHWMLQFGLGLSSYQSYKSSPVGWLVLARPISFYWCAYGTQGCSMPKGTASEVLAIGTPLIWWGGTLALIFCLNWWLIGLIGDLVFKRTPKRDWRAGAVLLGVSAGWLPWIWYAWHDNRTEFYYYAVVFDPFLVIAITLCLGLIIGPARAGPGRRAIGAVGAGGYLLAVLVNLAYIYPILTAEVIPYTDWLSRMWFRRWI
ncbi:MAG TPA: phospholipid carrier-dependent glycosyltransferase [Streptosporangiaceae bacterium]|jgi:dolichyl-phosphate-mannose-protein mannosyltransferase|nr:phospholipid carrier-dependent glycosyltransferase [Streptosporangiaceae bacterium]